MGYPQIVVTGDSIAQLSFKAGGYGSVLTDEYNGKLDIVNRGMGGYNSRQLLLKLQSDLVPVPTNVCLFVIHIGTNDSAISAIQTLSVCQFTQNLRAMVKHIRTTHPCAGIILLTPSIVDHVASAAWEDQLGVPQSLRSPRRSDNTIHYVQACISVGEQLDVPVIDCFAIHEEALSRGDSLAELFDDGLHYSTKGYSYINNALLQTIRTKFPKTTPESMSYAFPDFWTYGVEKDSAAYAAAPMFEVFRERAKEVMKQMSGSAETESPEATTGKLVAVA